MGVAVILATILGVIVTGEEYLRSQAAKPEVGKVIVIDPGHGGKDPGKVGCHNELEKEINLSIALRVAEGLEKEGFQVELTRSQDTTGTGDADSTKGEDMNARVDFIEKSKPLCCVSIHQNSYISSGVRGAQTFYYAGSEKSKALASDIQESLIANADPDNTREIKANDSYYLLLNTSCPIVIVECGFLSDEDEALKLASKEYQKILAEAIVAGIIEYVERE